MLDITRTAGRARHRAAARGPRPRAGAGEGAAGHPACRPESGDAGALAEATSETIHQVSEICSKLGVYTALNVGVTDGEAFVFTRYSTEGPGNSLYFVESGEAFPDAVVVASERLDSDEESQKVPDRHLLVASIEGVTTRPL